MWLFQLAEWYLRIRGKRYRRPKALASKSERIIALILEKHGITYEPQYGFHFLHTDFAVKYEDCLSFIEYDGPQHYHPMKKYGGIKSFFIQLIQDKLFNAQCADEGIKLLRIKYDTPACDIEEMILDFLGKETGRYTLPDPDALKILLLEEEIRDLKKENAKLEKDENSDRALRTLLLVCLLIFVAAVAGVIFAIFTLSLLWCILIISLAAIIITIDFFVFIFIGATAGSSEGSGGQCQRNHIRQENADTIKKCKEEIHKLKHKQSHLYVRRRNYN